MGDEGPEHEARRYGTMTVGWTWRSWARGRAQGPMLQTILERFPTPAHPLTLVSDPDGILADEVILAELSARGFRIITETDPVALRHRYHQLEPITTTDPVIVVTPGPLERLPYDLWQQGQHVTLALHTLFPNLDYPTLRLLSPAGRSRLAQVQARGNWPERPLSPIGTTDFLLTALFDARAELLGRPAGLLLWLARYHAAGDPLPAPLAERLLMQLQGAPELAGWPLAELIANPDACRRFVQEGWNGYISGLIGETRDDYGAGAAPSALDFRQDSALQDTVPALVRAGTLAPVTVDRPAEVPAWARPAVAVDEEGVRLRQLTETAEALSEQLAAETLRWEAWGRSPGAGRSSTYGAAGSTRVCRTTCSSASRRCRRRSTTASRPGSRRTTPRWRPSRCRRITSGTCRHGWSTATASGSSGSPCWCWTAWRGLTGC